ncbi:MAG: hypothetical protein WC718_00145 [Phycisphaerales bacterium]|jgi:hypothetical protein
MTTQRKQSIREWMPAVVAVVALALNLLVAGVLWGRLEQRVEHLEANAKDKDIHMTLDRQQQLFVTRSEYQNHLELMAEIKGDLREIKSRIGAL